jgi:NitT/TauT family transport system permease protein
MKNLFLTLLPGLIFLCAWQYIVDDNTRLQFLFASPFLVVSVAWHELTGTAIWSDTFTTFTETMLGLIFGTMIGTTLGLLLWVYGRIDKIARPYLVVLGAIPVFALAPVMIIWFGVGLLSKAVMAAFAVIFVSLLQAHEGAHATAREYLGLARSIAAPKYRMIIKIIIPGAVDWVIAGFKLNVGFALTGAFIGEFVSSEAGLGHYILKAGALYDMPRVIFGLAMMSGSALFLTSLAWLLQRQRRHLQ